RIAQNGRAGFYKGKTADLIVNEMQKQGGMITHEDLEHYESVWRDPVQVDFKGYELNIMPPPSSGSIAIAQIRSEEHTSELQSRSLHDALPICVLPRMAVQGSIRVKRQILSSTRCKNKEE